MTELFQLITIIFIVENVTLSVVRWFHICHPYSEIHYPARKIYSWLCFSSVFLIATIICPRGDVSWLYGMLFWSFHMPLTVSEMIVTYFPISKKNPNHKYLYLAGELLMLVGFVCTIAFERVLSDSTMYALLACVLILVCIAIITLNQRLNELRKIKRQYLLENYSNEEDYPIQPANVAFFTSFFVFIFPLIFCIFRSAPLYLCYCVGAIIVSPAVLLYFLHPHIHLNNIVRNHEAEGSLEQSVEELESDAAWISEKEAPFEENNKELYKILDEKLRHVIVDEKVYLDPHITLAQLAKIVGSNRTNVSQIISEHGGFYNVMNRRRLRMLRSIKLLILMLRWKKSP